MKLKSNNIINSSLDMQKTIKNFVTYLNNYDSKYTDRNCILIFIPPGEKLMFKCIQLMLQI